MTGGRPQASFRGLAAAVALITAELGTVDIDPAELVGDGEEAAVIRTLTVVASQMLAGMTTPAGTDRFLQGLALDLARAAGGGG